MKQCGAGLGCGTLEKWRWISAATVLSEIKKKPKTSEKSSREDVRVNSN